MKRNFTAILCLLLLFSVSVSGQKTRKKAAKTPTYTAGTIGEPVASGDRFFFLIALNKDGNAVTSLQNENGSVLTPAQSALFFKRLSRIGDTRLAPAAREALAPGVIIKPDRDLKYGTLLKAARAAQEPSDLSLRIATDDDNFYLAYPKLWKPDPISAKPNPLTLVVTVDNEDLLYLNSEPNGSMSDPGKLENRLKQIFKDRADNGVFRWGTNLIETAVFLRLSENTAVADLMKLVKVLRNAGSDWIGLDNGVVEMIREMREVPRTR